MGAAMGGPGVAEAARGAWVRWGPRNFDYSCVAAVPVRVRDEALRFLDAAWPTWPKRSRSVGSP